MDKILDKEARDEISFISFIIPEFAHAYKMPIQEAYRYLKKYGGLDYVLSRNRLTKFNLNPSTNGINTSPPCRKINGKACSFEFKSFVIE